MSPGTPEVTFPWEHAPADSEIASVAPGVGWLRFPLPFALDHVNIWLLDTADGPFLIDAGIYSTQSVSIWESVLEKLTLAPAGLLITHYHPDHVGMAGWLAERLAIPVWFSQQDLAYTREAYTISDADFSQAQDSWYQLHGLDEKRRAVMRHAGNTYRPNVYSLPASPLLLQHDDIWPVGENQWRIITVGGHAPEMICLYCEQLNVLIAADQLLPSITPNVSLNHYTQDANPLARFLSSFATFEELPHDVLVLPSHGLPYYGLHTRIAQLRRHHNERFDQLISACAEPQTAADMLSVMFQRKLDYQQLMFAMGESVAHLRYLDRAGRLSSSVEHEQTRYCVG